MGEPERFGCDDIERGWWLALTGENVEHNVAADRPAGQRFGAGGLDRLDPVSHHRGEDPHHLPIAIAMMTQAAADPLDCGRQHPVLERRSVA